MPELDELPGHSYLKIQIKKLLKSPPSTLLFEGPKGVGKSQFARAFAHALLSEVSPHKLASGNHPDLREYFPEGKTAMHPMHCIREIIEEAKLPPFESSRKVFIIHEADRMLPSSSNALLKTLEEPLASTLFILVSSRPGSLLPTVASRSFRLAFFLLSEEDIAAYIEKKWKKSREEALQIARLSQGNLARAEALAEKNDEQFLSLIAETGTQALLQNYPALFRLLSTLIKNEYSAEEILSALYFWYRDLHLLKLGGESSKIFFHSHVSSLRKCVDLPLPSFTDIQARMRTIEEALECNISLQHCLAYLLI